MRELLGVIILLSMYLIYLVGYHNSVVCGLKGFWSSPEDFNDEAGITSFSFYITKKINQYSGYMLMIGEDNEILINEPMTFCLNNSLQNLFSYDKVFQLKFYEKETDLIKKCLTLNYYPGSNKIILKDKQKVFAVFYKNNAVSEECIKCAPETPQE